MKILIDNKLLRRLLCTMVLVGLICSNGFSRGKLYQYTLTGIATSNTGQILANQAILVKFKNKKTDTLMTDSEGKYSYTYGWGTACISGIKSKRIRRQTKRANKKPEYIYFSIGKSKLKIKNAPENLPDIENKKQLDLVFKF